MKEPTTYVLEFVAHQIANAEGLPVLAIFLVWDVLTQYELSAVFKPMKRKNRECTKIHAHREP